MGLTFEQINNRDNAVRNLVELLTNDFALRKLGYKITPTHHKYYGKLG